MLELNSSEIDDSLEEALSGYDEQFSATGEDLADDSDADRSTLALFSGDEGGLSLEQRRALVCLMRNKFVSATGNPAEWRVIREHSQLIKSRLNDMFLDLHLDLQHEVAYKRKVISDGADFPTLLQNTAYTREETILLAYLRHRHRAEQQAGHDDVTVERQELLDYIATFRPPHATDRSRDKGRAEKAVDNMVASRVLTRTNDVDRLRISSVIAVLLPLARLAELHEWLIAKNGGQGTTAEDLGTDIDDDPQDVEDAEDVVEMEALA
ncbi:DUF4194 domain-containing protein [Sinosporangium siamense]|uniref:DUF4194 domain-containing protein n=1 Tax=Sinosporangium siamense TaxID=1367973 RepID=A0A919V7G9_9ACTN|nr:DUF4194 domain-containing protein [Sinosporangium siamense]GII95115.1 hypothetical protein Ssi02_53460 [Sinosporangium siamense]